MTLEQTLRSATLLFVLLNPFLLTVYLLGLVRTMSLGEFARAMARASLVSGAVFVVFAAVGDAIFRDVLQVRFAAFLVFGGIVFLVVALQFVFHGPDGIQSLRGKLEPSGAIAMPFMIGAGTINASVLAGSRQALVGAVIAIALALVATIVVVVVLKAIHDAVSARNEPLVDRYVDQCGRASALVIGAMAVEMIFQGLEQWWRIATPVG
jgi:multiple antibiotic resistance protein